MVMLANIILIIAVFLIQDIAILESASQSRRVVYQTFIHSFLYPTCYGTCTHVKSRNGYEYTTKDLRCEGNKLRLNCDHGNVIRVSFAFYGKLEAGDEVCGPVLLDQCRKEVDDIVGKDCNGKEFCLFIVDNARFGKFCQGQYFYMDVRFSCEFRPSTKELTESSTTTKVDTTTQLTTTPRTSVIKPITMYKDGKSNPSTINTGKNPRDSTTQGSTTNSQESTSQKSTEQSTSHSSSSSAPTHVPISSSGISTQVKTTRNSDAAAKLLTTLPTSLGRSSEKKASLYWLLTAHSLVTDKGFIEANSTHLVLAIILSIFIALVISICFVLDHCRRQKNRNAAKELRENCVDAEEGTHLENGSPLGYDMNRELVRPKSRSHANSLVGNGSAKHLSIHSLDEFNHNTEQVNEQYPLLPVRPPSLASISREGMRETCRSPVIDHLPPPPEELLLDTPKQDMGGYLDDNESESSTVSIPPPIGFADADIANRSMPASKSEMQIATAFSPTGSSVVSNYASLPKSSKGAMSLPKIDNSKRMNNEFYGDISTSTHASNLLHNSVSVQTNDLRDILDKRSRTENAGQVSMRSPNYEVSDTYATTDKISNIAAIDFQELNLNDLYNMKDNCLLSKTSGNEINGQNSGSRIVEADDLKKEAAKALACKTDPLQNAKRGRLIVLNSSPDKSFCTGGSSPVKYDTSETKSLPRKYNTAEKFSLDSPPRRPLSEGKFHENVVSGIKPTTANGSLKLKRKDMKLTDDVYSKDDEKINYTACASSSECDTSVLPRYDAVSKQIFAVPKHRCGMGHNHPCVCIPLRTGSSSFICSCLENAKYKPSKCCMEKCPDERQTTGIPYSSQRSSNGRGLATDVPKRKNYNNNTIKRASSLERIHDKFADAKTSGKKVELLGNHKIGENSTFNDAKSKTLPILQSKLKKTNPNNPGSKTLDRVHWGLDSSARQDPKLIPVIVHSSRNKQAPRFEKNKERLEDKTVPTIQKDPFRSNRSEDSDSSDRSGSTEGRPVSLPTTPIEKRRKKNGHPRLSPISENASKKASSQENKSWQKKSPKFRVQVVESVHYDKRKLANEV